MFEDGPKVELANNPDIAPLLNDPMMQIGAAVFAAFILVIVLLVIFDWDWKRNLRDRFRHCSDEQSASDSPESES